MIITYYLKVPFWGSNLTSLTFYTVSNLFSVKLVLNTEVFTEHQLINQFPDKKLDQIHSSVNHQLIDLWLTIKKNVQTVLSLKINYDRIEQSSIWNQ